MDKSVNKLVNINRGNRKIELDGYSKIIIKGA